MKSRKVNFCFYYRYLTYFKIMSLIKARLITVKSGISIQVTNGAQGNTYGISSGIGTIQSFTSHKEPYTANKVKANKRKTVTNERAKMMKLYNMEDGVIQVRQSKAKEEQDKHQDPAGKGKGSVRLHNSEEITSEEDDTSVKINGNITQKGQDNHQEDDVITREEGDTRQSDNDLTKGVCGKLTGGDYTNQDVRDELHDENEIPVYAVLLCSVCNENRKITNYCLNCGLLTCHQCETDHQGKEHEFVKRERKPGLETYDTCAKHKKYDIDLFCLQCKTYICVACKALTHVQHSCFDLKYDNDYVKPVIKDVVDEMHTSLLDYVKIEQTVSIATGIEWIKCSAKKKAKHYCLTFLCRLI